MTKKAKPSDAEILDLIMPAAEEGIRYTRPGDVKTARDYIGVPAYSKVIEWGCEIRAGELIAAAVAFVVVQ